MRTSVALLVGAVLLTAFALAGSATATQSADSAHNGTDSGDDGPEVGVCMIGVDSPCNGEEWDGDENDTNGGNLQPVADGNESNDVVDNRTEKDGHDTVTDGGGEHEAGICLVGADTACNNDFWADGSNGFVPGSPIETAVRAIAVLF